jgi:dinuclear metal center YbgI/SA1388 family protein
MKLNTIVKFLNQELHIYKIADVSRNGLQVKGKKEIKKVGFAVDSCLSTFEKAKKSEVDLLIVHHGNKWWPQKHKEAAKLRENFLLKNKISLYAAHLPLDAHEKYGNNILLCKVLNLNRIVPFGRYGLSKIGYSGLLKKNSSATEIGNFLDKKIKTKCQIFHFGKKNIKSVGIVSGSGGSSIEEAVKEKLDCLITGEIKLSDYHRANDFGLNLIVAGHYATETVGVKALQKLIREKFKLKTEFIDNPVPI